MNKAQTLLEVFDDLTWENYVDIADTITLFNEHEIDTEMARQASVYSYYQGLLSISKQKLDDANLTLTQYTAMTRKEKKDASSVKLTAKDLDDYVESRDTFRVHTKSVNDAQFKYTLKNH